MRAHTTVPPRKARSVVGVPVNGKVAADLMVGYARLTRPSLRGVKKDLTVGAKTVTEHPSTLARRSSSSKRSWSLRENGHLALS
jgi:hypothetical protein